VDFPDYSPEELFQIAQRMCQERQYRLSPSAALRLKRLLAEGAAATPYAGNARFVRNVIERAVRRQAVRLVRRRQVSRDDLVTLEAADVTEAAYGCSAVSSSASPTWARPCSRCNSPSTSASLKPAWPLPKPAAVAGSAPWPSPKRWVP